MNVPATDAAERTSKAAAQPDLARSARPQLGRFAKVVRNLSLATLAFSALAAAVLWGVSETTWWGTVFTFCPRHPFLVVPAVLLVLSLFTHRWSILTNGLSLLIVAGPLMGGRLPLGGWSSARPDGRCLSVVSCNVQEFRPDFESVLREIAERHPDVVAFQEGAYEHDLCRRFFPGWHTVEEPNLWVGSRFPLRRLDIDPSAPSLRGTVLSVRIETPQGPVVLHNVHLPTPRRGLTRLSIDSVLSGEGSQQLEEWTRRRMATAWDVRSEVARNQSFPTLVVGDFNTPTVSNLYRDVWQNFTNAFDEAGVGFGYTAPCTAHAHWFNDVPWVRIDHILADEAWSVRACEIGHGRGSDHRPIWAILARNAPAR